MSLRCAMRIWNQVKILSSTRCRNSKQMPSYSHWTFAPGRLYRPKGGEAGIRIKDSFY